MSNIYNLEPPTKGKVILHTSLGDLEIELWAKEAPTACRNFVQLCLEGYYDNTIFHRVIKDYIAQGGDPTGSGTGGESIYGQPFKDEFHSRLKFTRRGLVACANQNSPHTNGSQFFITLDKTDWLDKVNTIFGRVVGDTVYNLLRFNDLAVDDADRPLEPPVVKDVEVVWNPFDDIVPRVDKAALRAQAEAKRAAEQAKKRSAGRTKNLALLSFGDEAEQEEAELAQVAATRQAASKIRSAHDVLEDGRLAKELAVEEEFARPAKKVRNEAGSEGGRGESGDEADDGGAGRAAGRDFAAAMRAKMVETRKQMGDAPAARPLRQPEAAGTGAGAPPSPRGGDRDEHRDVKGGGGRPRVQGIGGSGSGSDEEEEDGDGGGRPRRGGSRGRDYLAERQAELDQMRAEAKNRSYGRVKTEDKLADADLLKPWQLSREQYKQRKRLTGNREKDTLARLAKFQSVLRGSGEAAPPATADEAQAAPSTAAAAAADGEEGYAGKVRADLDHKAYMPAAWRVDDYLEEAADPQGGDDVASLRAHRFEATRERKDAMARDMANLDDYVVVDPLLEKAKGKFSKANQREAKRNNEWAGRANA